MLIVYHKKRRDRWGRTRFPFPIDYTELETFGTLLPNESILMFPPAIGQWDCE